MRTVAVEYNVYKYNELSDSAKEKVKEWYLTNVLNADMFTDDCKEDLRSLFGENELDVQYSLSYCQGDGFNIYGKIYAEDIFNCLENHNGGRQLAIFEDALTEKEKRTILHYAEECGAIELPMNRHYCYSMVDSIDIVSEWEDKLYGYKNINVDTLEKFDELVKDMFDVLCRHYENWGYKFFYEIEDDDMEDVCEANDWEFLEDGTFF